MKHGSLLALVVLALGGSNLLAQDENANSWPLKDRVDLNPRTGFFGYHTWKTKKEPDPAAERLYRAGCPHTYLPWAKCPDDRHYTGYYVGGGAAIGGEERCPQCEGTWGWDYKLPWQRVRLNWFHGSRYQGGEGQYNPDRNNNPLSH